MSTTRQMHLGAFLFGVGHHLAAWRHPDVDPGSASRIADLRHWAQVAEAAKFDAVFFADNVGLSEAPAAAAAKDAEPDGWKIGFTPAPSLFMSGNDPLRILRELEHLGPLEIACRMERLPGFKQIDPLEAYLAWDLGLVGAVLVAVGEGRRDAGL